MVKVKSPLLSQTASGTIAGVLTFSNRKSGQQVRTQKKQKDVITVARTEQRAKYLEAVSAWHLLTPTEKSNWTRNAVGQNMTGYNLFISIFLGEYTPAFSLAYYGVAIYGDTLYGGI